MVNEKCYIGSAVDVHRRWAAHRCQLSLGKHHSSHLQRAWLKYGKSAFRIEVIEPVLLCEDLIRREQFWIDVLAPAYNVCPTAGSTLGRKLSDETRKKIGLRSAGRQFSEASRLKMSASATGRKHTAVAKLKIALAKKGRKRAPFTAEARKNMSDALRKRWTKWRLQR